MDEIYTIAARYYKRLESFSAYGGIRNIYFLFFLIVTSFGIAIFAHYDGLYPWFLKHSSRSTFHGLLVIIEFAAVSFLFKSISYRDKNVVKQVSQEFDVNIKTFSEAKVFLLKKYLPYEQNEFAVIAKQLQEMLDASEKYFDNKHWIDKFFAFLFNEEAKNRILTLFVLMCSIITILTVNAGANLETLYESLHYTETTSLWAAFSLTLFLFLTIWLGTVVFTKAVRRTLIFISLSVAKENSKNVEMIKYLIADLIKYHTFKSFEHGERRLILFDLKEKMK